MIAVVQSQPHQYKKLLSCIYEYLVVRVNEYAHIPTRYMDADGGKLGTSGMVTGVALIIKISIVPILRYIPLVFGGV